MSTREANVSQGTSAGAGVGGRLPSNTDITTFCASDSGPTGPPTPVGELLAATRQQRSEPAGCPLDVCA